LSSNVPPGGNNAETEAGIRWAELTAMQNARLDAMEDCFEAELACGRHHAVLSELEAVVEADKLRERSCGQLMLALYRCGRQADALSVYGRVRSALINDLGLEPGEGPNLWFAKVPEGKTAKNRMHFDLRAPGSIAQEVERLTNLGAAVLHGTDDLVVMQDPEGNEFCVE
jgi:DNA-binding SARP family transcriptional activator